jgi:hypothetical protein
LQAPDAAGHTSFRTLSRALVAAGHAWAHPYAR